GEVELGAVGRGHHHLARLEPGDQRRVARRDAELAHFAGGHDHGGLAAEDLGLGTDDVATDGGHYLSRFARSMGIGKKGNEGNGWFQEARRSVRRKPTIPFIPYSLRSRSSL